MDNSQEETPPKQVTVLEVLFCKKGMTSERIKKSAKKLSKVRNLCYSIDEANRVLNGHCARPASTGANGRNMLGSVKSYAQN